MPVKMEKAKNKGQIVKCLEENQKKEKKKSLVCIVMGKILTR